MHFRICLSVFLLAASAAPAQTPTGTIAGTVTDPSGAVVPNCLLTITNDATGLGRKATTDATGNFSAPALAAGKYTVVAEMQGFQKASRSATVEIGSTTTVNLTLVLGTPTEVIIAVQDATPQLNFESNTVQGVVTRRQIDSLPLNGRDFLQLAFLQPGVGVGPSDSGGLNRRFNVSILGGDSSQTRVTVDGINVVDSIDGGTQQGFSQEIVQEFQISTVNPDASTGFSPYGAVNIVSRSGENTFHGGGYFFFRDHNLAAYPALARDPSNPKPYFARRQPGFNFGGPILRKKLFFFTNVEHTNQTSVLSVQPLEPDFAHFGVLETSPYKSSLFSTRLDYELTPTHAFFLRYSHDGNHTFSPRSGLPLPSDWVTNRNWADQGTMGWTSTLRSNLVNDFRFAWTYWRNDNLPPGASDCSDCIGLGGPEINVDGSGFTIGNNREVPQIRYVRHVIASDSVSWQKGSHRLRFGGEWDHAYASAYYLFMEPAILTVYSPTVVRQYNATAAPEEQIPIPDSFQNLDDILLLPLKSFEMGIGNPLQPPPFQRNLAGRDDRIHFYVQDVWRARSGLTFTLGLGYDRENNLLNQDIERPQFLEPLVGKSGLGLPPQRNRNFSPSVGFAWTPGSGNRTVIRGGFGIQYGTMVLFKKLADRAYVGPIGNGRMPLPGDIVPNPIPDIPGVPLGMPLSFRSNPTNFRAAHLMAILPDVRGALEQTIASFGNPNDLSVRTIDVFKSAAGDALLPNDFMPPQTQYFNLGVQRQIRPDLALTADFVWRHTIRQDMEAIDYNRWNRASGPVMRPCSPEEAFDPTARCSLGEIPFRTSAGRQRYAALLLRLERRFSGRYQYTVSYALQDQVGFNGIVNYDNWFESWGPQIARHSLNASAMAALPFGLQLSSITMFGSRAPFTATISGIDLSGSGTDSSILPGSKAGEFNMGRNEADLRSLVAQFNTTYAGKLTPRGQVIPSITLPAGFAFGDRFFSQDVRLGKSFDLRSERVRLLIFAEAFNLFNTANLQGYSGNLRESASFGQPTARVNQLFGSGGPRIFQLGGRISF